MTQPGYPTNGPLPKADPDTRKSRLAQGVHNEVVRGAMVESQSDYNAVLRYGKPINHMLHLILTLVTCGCWSLVWLILYIMQATEKKTVTLTVDEFGQVLRQQT